MAAASSAGGERGPDIYIEARSLARARGPYRWLAPRMERRWAAAAGRVVTVNRAYAEVIGALLRVPEPLVVMNCSVPFVPTVPRERRFHDALHLDPAAAVGGTTAACFLNAVSSS